MKQFTRAQLIEAVNLLDSLGLVRWIRWDVPANIAVRKAKLRTLPFIASDDDAADMLSLISDKACYDGQRVVVAL